MTLYLVSVMAGYCLILLLSLCYTKTCDVVPIAKVENVIRTGRDVLIHVRPSRQIEYPTESVILNATESYPLEGASLRYNWTQTNGSPLHFIHDPLGFIPPSGFFDTDKAVASFVPPMPGLYTFNLTVTDTITQCEASVSVPIDILVIENDAAYELYQIIILLRNAILKSGDPDGLLLVRTILGGKYPLCVECI